MLVSIIQPLPITLDLPMVASNKSMVDPWDGTDIRGPRWMGSECNRWGPGESVAPLRHPNFTRSYRQDRISNLLGVGRPQPKINVSIENGCLIPKVTFECPDVVGEFEADPRTLADFDPQIYDRPAGVDHQIKSGSFQDKATSSIVARSHRYFGPEENNPTYKTIWEPRITPGEDFHDRIWREVTSGEEDTGQIVSNADAEEVVRARGAETYDGPVIAETHGGIDRNRAALEQEIQESADTIRKLQNAYEESLRLREWTIPGHIVCETKTPYVSPRPAWQIEGGKYHTPAYGCLSGDEGASAASQLKGVKVRKPTKEDLKEAKRLTGMSGEIGGVKTYGKPIKEPNGNRDNMEDDDSGGVFEFTGAHIEDHGRKSKNPLHHTDLVHARKLKYRRFKERNRLAVIALDVLMTNEPREEAAQIRGISYDALQKQIERLREEINFMDDKVYIPFTEEELNGILQGEVYALIDLNGWKRYHLDLRKYGTVELALAALRQDKMKEAFRHNRRAQLTKSKDELTAEIKSIYYRYESAFDPENVKIQRKRGTGFRGALAQAMVEIGQEA